ncbi:hypothetical protein AHAS_Ahas12G0048300 [Arachis hypogaea]
MIAEEIDDAAIIEEELNALLMMDTKEMMEDLFASDLDDNQQLHSWDNTLSNMDMEYNPEKMKEELEAFFMMDTKENWEETEATKHSQPQLQPHTTNFEEQCSIEVGVNQPPGLCKISEMQSPNRLESPPQPYCQSLPLPQPQLECPPPQPSSQSLPLPLPQLGSPLQSQHQSKSQTDISKMTEQFFNDTWGYQPPLEMIAVVGGHQQHQVWTWEENKAFESVIANCFQDAIHNHWKTVAARLPGKTPAQLQERFLKLMTDVNAIKNGNPENMNIMIPVSATPLEHSLLSIPVVNATPPLPPPHWTHHQHHRMQAMAPAADMAVPMHITLLSSSMSGARREQNQHANSNIIQHKPLYAASSNNNKRQQTVHWTLQEHKHVVSPRLRRIRKTMVKNFK